MSAEPRIQSIAIILHIASDKTADFEAMFEAEEIPIWDDFAARDLFRECSLTRVTGGPDKRARVEDYILHIVATEEGHAAHDDDPRFRSFLERAKKLQPEEPHVWFGDRIFQRP